MQWKVLKSARNSSLLLKHPNVELLVNRFNNDPENISSKYYDTDEIRIIEISNKNNLFLFHINSCSLNGNFDDIQHLLSCKENNFDIIRA